MSDDAPIEVALPTDEYSAVLRYRAYEQNILSHQGFRILVEQEQWSSAFVVLLGALRSPRCSAATQEGILTIAEAYRLLGKFFEKVKPSQPLPSNRPPLFREECLPCCAIYQTPSGKRICLREHKLHTSESENCERTNIDPDLRHVLQCVLYILRDRYLERQRLDAIQSQLLSQYAHNNNSGSSSTSSTADRLPLSDHVRSNMAGFQSSTSGSNIPEGREGRTTTQQRDQSNFDMRVSLNPSLSTQARIMDHKLRDTSMSSTQPSISTHMHADAQSSSARNSVSPVSVSIPVPVTIPKSSGRKRRFDDRDEIEDCMKDECDDTDASSEPSELKKRRVGYHLNQEPTRIRMDSSQKRHVEPYNAPQGSGDNSSPEAGTRSMGINPVSRERHERLHRTNPGTEQEIGPRDPKLSSRPTPQVPDAPSHHYISSSSDIQSSSSSSDSSSRSHIKNEQESTFEENKRTDDRAFRIPQSAPRTNLSNASDVQIRSAHSDSIKTRSWASHIGSDSDSDRDEKIGSSSNLSDDELLHFLLGVRERDWSQILRDLTEILDDSSSELLFRLFEQLLQDHRKDIRAESLYQYIQHGVPICFARSLENPLARDEDTRVCFRNYYMKSRKCTCGGIYEDSQYQEHIEQFLCELYNRRLNNPSLRNSMSQLYERLSSRM